MTSTVASPSSFNPVLDLRPVASSSSHPIASHRLGRPKNSYAAYVMGTAFFDLNGLPQSWLNNADIMDLNWVQTTFEALRLQSLLSCWLKLRGMQHVTIRGSECHILLVRQCDRYMGLLIQPHTPEVAFKVLLRWAKTMKPKFDEALADV